MNFVHLNTHSNASILHASARVTDLVDRAKELGQKAIALTDYSNMYSSIDFYAAAKKADMKPIMGIDLFFCESCEESKIQKVRQVYHLTLIAKNNVGWKNLNRLVSEANHEDNYFYRPRVDFALLEKYSEGVIMLTGGMDGIIPYYLHDKIDSEGDVRDTKAIFRAEALTRRFVGIFGTDNLFFEVQNTNQPQQEEVNKSLRKLGNKYGIKTVATGNVHYVHRHDAEAHKTLLDMNFSAFNKLTTANFDEEEFFLKSAEELIEEGLLPEELECSVEIAARCNVEIDLDARRLPAYEFIPEGLDAMGYLREIALKGYLAKGIDKQPDFQVYVDRMKRELADIEDMGFADYFLIVYDVVQWAYSKEILLGFSRGSAGGSLTSYLLGITGVDPIEYGLIWERFLNKGRGGLPDIDTDVPRSRRQEVLEYIRNRFGEDKVAQLVTFNTLQARAVLKDVFKVYEMPFSEANAITRLVPEKSDDHSTTITVEEALAKSPPLREAAERYKAWFEVAKALYGCYRGIGMHPSAVVISDKSLSDSEYPLTKAPKNQSLLFGLDMGTVDRMNLLKLDILGLNTLDDIQVTRDLVKARHSIVVTRELMPLDDAATYSLISSGLTTGVFQIEKQLGKTWSKALEPRTIEEIGDLISLIRPAALDNNLTEQYRKTKHGEMDTEPLHPLLLDIVKDTYGVLCYQEQTIFTCQKLAGFSLVESDSIRKVIGKKLPEELKLWKPKFIDGCTKNGVDVVNANEIWSQLEKFAGYQFNKCLHYKTKILLPNGSEPTILSLFKENYRGPICSVDPRTGYIKNSFVEDIKLAGTQDCYSVELINGDIINVTKGHKFITPSGPKKICDINIGEYIGSVQRIDIDIKSDISINQAMFLGCLIAEGNLCHPSSLYFSSSRPDEREFFTKLARSFHNTDCVEDVGYIAVHTKRINIKEPQEAFEFCKKLGILLKTATEKELPSEVLLASEESIAAFLGAVWTGDGHVGQVSYYATSSLQLMKDIRFLCLRLGIVTSFKRCKFNYTYKGITQTKIGYKIFVLGHKSWDNFKIKVSPYFFGKRLEDFNKVKDRTHKFAGIYDGLPRSFIDDIRNEICYSGYGRGYSVNSSKSLCKRAGISSRVLQKNNQKTISYYWLNKLNNVLNSQKITDLVSSDIAWLPVKSIKKYVKADVYDITVKDTHTLIADGVLTMNSHAIGYAFLAYETAYLKTHYTIEFLCAKLRNADDNDKLVPFIHEARLFDIEVTPPRLSAGNIDFDIITDHQIAFGLSSLKGAGKAALTALAKIDLADSKDPLYDLFGRALRKGSKISTAVIVGLIKSGALDDLELDRVRMLSSFAVYDGLSLLERDLIEVLRKGRPEVKNWISFVRGIADEDRQLEIKEQYKVRMPSKPRRAKIRGLLADYDASEIFDSMRQKLTWERDYLGIALSGDGNLFKSRDSCKDVVNEGDSGMFFDLAVQIDAVSKIFDRNGNEMAFVNVSDDTCSLDGICVFSNQFREFEPLLEEGNIVSMGCKMGDRGLIANSLERL